MMSREAMQMALEALEDANDVARMEFSDEDYYSEAINALRQALEIETEPVAWASSLDFDDDDQEIIPAKDKGKLGTSNCDIPLYTAPPKQWVGLTDEDIAKAVSHLYDSQTARNMGLNDDVVTARAIEAKLKEKNT
jgi:hypothetical protein